ncbi:flagellin [Azospirillum thermophilum]|uniref:Flagellin C-terminal domain-containing protein n=1 Tax=Azospirillum thermophilum TaxID=2202148 RepID=A0A2S2CW44_9PROT|nr:hypothetical protein [Azospirillum thermophilum]AWK88696.1 hypothetical protein DEW08_21610 [Azospirillum thermophilum]
MSTITQVSTYSRYLSLVRNLTNGQGTVDSLSQQLTTGKKSVDLNAYGPEVQKLLDLRAEMARRNNYVQNIDTASPRLQATDKVLTSLEKLATDWQSSNLMPFEPGPPSVTSTYNANADAMDVSLNLSKSKLMVGARFTVTAVPSKDGANGTYDVTVSDGLGGTSTRSINLKTVPPNDGGGYNFKIAGGPGEGAVLNLDFKNLQAASSSNFTVTFPKADQMKERAEGALRDIRQYLNERFGERFLFSGSRFSTEPVTDLSAGPQVTKVTLNGPIVSDEDYFEVTINGRKFGYQVGPTDPKTLSSVADALTQQIAKADPPLPVTLQSKDGIITVTGKDASQKFDVSARVFNSASIDNSATTPTTVQAATATAQQVDSFTLTGDKVDIGDTFEFSVHVGDPDDPFNQKYYTQYPNEPRDLPPYTEYKVSYTVTEKDYNAGVTDTTQVATQLRQQFNTLYPNAPLTAQGSGATILPTSNGMLDPNHPNRTQLFSTTAKAVNGSVQNTVSVATLPPVPDKVMDIPDTTPPDLPFYDSEFLTKGKNPEAYRKAMVTADDSLNITYGVTADDQAFQTLIKAFRLARAAASNPGKYEELVGQSRSLMAEAQGQVRNIHAKVASDLATLEDQKTTHKTAIATLTDRVAKIEGIDETEVAARLSSAMNTLQASYTVAGQTQKLSLLNYIA